MSAHGNRAERLDELLIDRATEGLDKAAERELESLLAELDLADADGFDRAAAALDLAIGAGVQPEPLPADLAAKIAADAVRYLPHGSSAERELDDSIPAGWPPSVDAPARAGAGLRLVAVGGWIAAAAACVALTVVWRTSADDRAAAQERLALLDDQLTTARVAAQGAAEEAQGARRATADLEAALAEERQRSEALLEESGAVEERQGALLAQLDSLVQREEQLEEKVADLEDLLYAPPPEVALAEFLASPPPDLVRVPWSSTADPLVAQASVGGEVIWSDSLQSGFMVLDGMPVNQMSEAQYQLWIFSSEQKESTPVDGGVFDSVSTERIVVPIDAKLGVRAPSLFAVTLEKPGGVVVSERDRLLLAAPL